VPTDFGGSIDLLCLNSVGDLVIVELKREKTPREITAQVLDCASWVKDLSYDNVVNIAESYLKSKGKPPLADIFKLRLDANLPEVLNDTHSMIIVATLIDSASERVINYLSSTYGVDINAATFQYFKDGIAEYLARTFLITQIETDRSKKKRRLSLEELQNIADKNGVGDMFADLVSALQEHFKPRGRIGMLTFSGIFEGSHIAFFNLIPEQSNKESGLLFKIYVNRFMNYFSLDQDAVFKMLPKI
jgi:hypothetical protein